MLIDIPTLLIGAGFALFIALLAWGNQIREPRKEISNIEYEFRNEFNLEKSEINPLIRDSEDKNVKKYTFMDTSLALISIMGKNTLQDTKRVNLISKLKELNIIRSGLEKLYKTRYLLTLTLTLMLFILGLLSLYTSDWTINIQLLTITVNNLYLVIILVIIFVILINLILTYRKENIFLLKMSEISDDIEGK